MIKKIIEQKKIPFLCHFTDIMNLPNILQNGLIPRQTLVNEEQLNFYNDSVRLDGHPNANCLSISYPNYRMFYRCRIMNPKKGWAVILLKNSILYEKDCLFFRTNAANNSMIPHRDLRHINSIDAFNNMFYDTNLRGGLQIPIHYTTDPQAEVLVFDIIDPSYIGAIILQNRFLDSHILDPYRNSINIYINQETNIDFFTYRQDYAYWR